jgi:AraC family transcriptional regulator of adaptative response / DNA-3-methyladenine glycosylase II
LIIRLTSRRAKAFNGAMRELPCELPLHVASLLAFFAARAVPGVEEVDGTTYRRSVRLSSGPGVIALELGGERPSWRLERGDARDAAAAAALCRTLLDADADPGEIDASLGADPLLRDLVAGAPGRRVPGCADPAEIAVRAVLGQQVSVAAARTQAGRLAERAGERLAKPCGAVTHLFPAPAALAGLDPETLPMPRARGRALVAMAAALAEGLDPRERAAFLALRGVGPWTADYVAMRCGDRDVLLETDLGVRRGFARLADPAALVRRAEAWRPWRSYAVQHLWSLA